MARSNSGSTSNYLEMSFAPVVTLPVTIVAMVKLAGTANGEQCVLRIGSAVTRDDMVALEVNNSDVLPVTAENTAYVSATKSGLGASTWTKIAGTFTSSFVTAYRSGVAGTPVANTKNFANGTINRTTALAYLNPVGGTHVNAANMEIAEVAVYQAELTAAELLDYESGARPIERLRTGALRAYWKMNDGTGSETNYTNAPSTYTLAETGTVGQTTHPSVTAYAADGSLSVLLTNRRYLTLDGTTPFFLVGSGHWHGLVDYSSTAPPVTPTNYTAQFAIEAGRGVNHIRLFSGEFSRLNGTFNTEDYFAPLPWARTGPSTATDGGLKFDFNTFDTDYFARLRAICQLAATYGMHVIVMLFDGLAFRGSSTWKSTGHPANSANNINSISGDVNADGTMLEWHTRNTAAFNTIQEAYVTKVLDQTYDLPNVIYEISNEDDDTAAAQTWQAYWCDYIRANEQSRPATYRHLIHRSPSGGVLTDDQSVVTLANGDLVAPSYLWSGYGTFATPTLTIEVGAATPPRLYNTDHTGFANVTVHHLWEALTSGHAGVTYMDDPYGEYSFAPGGYPSATIRSNLAYIKTYANRLHLATCVPSTALASTGYCIANPGTEYLVYQPGSTAFTVNLSAVTGSLSVRWLNTNDGAISTALVSGGSAAQTMTPPFGGSPSGLVVSLTTGRPLLVKN